MHSILGRVPGAEKNLPKSNHSAPQQPHPDDALRPVRPPRKLLKQRGGCKTAPTLPLGGSECEAFWGGCLERRKTPQSQITQHPNNPTRTTPFGPSDLPESC
jgi:hypothetical protein